MTLRLLFLAIVAFGLNSALSAQNKSKGNPPDLELEIFKQLREAYKASYEVPEDVRDDLRASYKPGAKSREASIIRDLRRLYEISDAEEAALVKEIRAAIAKPSSQNEDYFFKLLSKLRKLPEGTVPAAVQLQQSARIFERWDEDRNGKLDTYEMSEDLKASRDRWDANRDGFIVREEYWAYYQDRLRVLSEEVATGKLDLGLKRGGPTIPPPEERRPMIFRAGKLPKNLPPWFIKLDNDNDGQISLFEWRRNGKSLDEFAGVDRNGDGLVTPEETLRYVTTAPPASDSPSESTSPGKRGRKTK